MYSEINDKEKDLILKMSGASVYIRSKTAYDEAKITNEKRKQMLAFWLNQHNIKGKWNKYEANELEEEALRVFN